MIPRRWHERWKDARGMSRLGWLILLLLLISAVYTGFQVLPFFYSYWEIEGLMQAQAGKASEFSDQEMRAELLRRIRKLGIPIVKEEDLRINRFNGKITIDLQYSEVFYVDFGNGWDYDIWEFSFNPHAEQRLAR